MVSTPLPLAALAACGLWLAVPVTGCWALRLTVGQRGAAVPLPVSAAVGIAIWSIPLLTATEAGLFSPVWMGVAGWSVAALAWARGIRPQTPIRWRARSPAAALLLFLGLLLVTALNIAFPVETIPGGRDQAVYANTAVFLAREGHVQVPYPWQAEDEFIGPMARLPGLYPMADRMVPQFAHLFPAWLAQAHASFGHRGLFGLNAVFAAIAAGCFFAVCRMLVRIRYAVAATLFLAFNPSQIYLARITLSEVLCQALIWCGIFLLVSALRRGDGGVARWAGLAFTVAALVRIDSLVLLPFLMIGHFLHKSVETRPLPRRRLAAAWPAFYQTAVPGFAAALWVYGTFSSKYAHDLRHHVWTLSLLFFGAAVGLLIMTPNGHRRLGVLLRRRAFAASAITLVVFASAYAYWLRPADFERSTEPAQVDAPAAAHDPAATERRRSLVNLGRYVSPPLLAAALLGFAVLACGGLRSRPWLPVLVMLAGVTAAYVYDPVVSPDHFWAVRRFVPVVIPALLLFASVGVYSALRRCPRRVASIVGLLTVLAAGGFTAAASGPMLLVGENTGSFERLATFAQTLPRGPLILAPITKAWQRKLVLPLSLTFGHRIYPLRTDPASKSRAHAWIADRLERGEPVYLLGSGDGLPRFLPPPIRLSSTIWHEERFRPTTRPLPHERMATDRPLTLFQVEAPRAAATDRVITTDPTTNDG